MAITNLTPNIRFPVSKFIETFAVPSVPESCILYGNQNQIALPKTNDYIIFTLLNSIRHGTGIEHYELKGDDFITLLETVEIPVQIDCYAENRNNQDGLNAYFRAQSLERVARSSIGVEFFNRFGLSCLYADDPREITFVGDSNQYVRRWTTTLHVSMKAGVNIPIEFFDAATVGLHNIDVSYPPKE